MGLCCRPPRSRVLRVLTLLAAPCGIAELVKGPIGYAVFEERRQLAVSVRQHLEELRGFALRDPPLVGMKLAGQDLVVVPQLIKGEPLPRQVKDVVGIHPASKP